MGQSSEDRVFSRRKPQIKSPRGQPVLGVLGKEGEVSVERNKCWERSRRLQKSQQPCPGDVEGGFRAGGLVPGAVGSGGRY